MRPQRPQRRASREAQRPSKHPEATGHTGAIHACEHTNRVRAHVVTPRGCGVEDGRQEARGAASSAIRKCNITCAALAGEI